ncbi:Cobalt-precorrin 5A hydrolase [hydrothermal vent metagenome]|uniref:Cobalt-precorrin 5A hydrolase n=1 Tax=hydrothermal vent metagenome TaxID=652676 RepID=A0A3B1CA49_9ZZZZ
MSHCAPVRLAMLAITKHASRQVKALALKMPEAEIIVSEKFAPVMGELPNKVIVSRGPLRPQIGDIFARYDQLVFFVSLGAVVRLIAPHLKSKEEDPAVVAVDDAARFVIPLLSGHVGGANALAERLADWLGATAVLTTASDAGKTISVDILGRELGWKVDAPKINITRVSAHVVNEEAIALVQECGSKDWWMRATPIPGNIQLFDNFEQVDLEQFKAVLWITRRNIPDELRQRLHERLVVYRPPEGLADG